MFDRSLLLVLALWLAAISADRAGAQSADAGPPAGACFEIVPPQRHAQPQSPLLFNKCTGQTWILVRTPVQAAYGARGGRAAYRWALLEVEAARPGEAANPQDHLAAVPRPAAGGGPRTGGTKCFEFTGRQFCE